MKRGGRGSSSHLDVDRAADALAWADRLSGRVGGFKIGLELFVAEGPGLVREFVDRGERFSSI